MAAAASASGSERLVDGHVLLALDDALHGVEVGVLPGDGGSGSTPAALEGGDDAGGDAVVGREDAVDAVRTEGRDGGGHVGVGVLRCASPAVL